MIFETVNEINEAIKSINHTSYLIRRCALNSQIVIANISFVMQQASGFSPISVELIHLSNLIEARVNRLILIVFESLKIITENQKIQRSRNLHEKCFRKYNEQTTIQKFNFSHLEEKIFLNYDLQLADLKNKFHLQFNSLEKIVKEIMKLCKNGRPIIFSVKIESVYIGQKQEVFNELSVELGNFISTIESLLKKIELLNLKLNN